MTTTIQLTEEPVQVSTGSNYVVIQALDGKNFRWCNSATLPNKDAYHYTDSLNIGLGAIIWIWGNGPNHTSTIAITTIEGV